MFFAFKYTSIRLYNLPPIMIILFNFRLLNNKIKLYFTIMKKNEVQNVLDKAHGINAKQSDSKNFN